MPVSKAPSLRLHRFARYSFFSTDVLKITSQQARPTFFMSTTGLISTIAPHFVPYLEMHGLAGDSYYFRKESTSLRDADDKKRLWHPRIKHTMLRNFHNPAEGILYAAFPKSVMLHALHPDDLLYIGCSSAGGARFWRGRPDVAGKFPEPKSCFHHEQMRRGRAGSNLEKYLAEVGPVVLHTLTDADVQRTSEEHHFSLPDGKYPSHQLERAILSEGFTRWKWNARA